jgi:SAM-dependent methyltransferase
VGASCASCGATYVRTAGISDFLTRDTESVEHRKAGRLIENARLYDGVQRLLGRRAAFLRLQSVLGDTSGQLLLDLGGGTGSLVPFLSPGTRYLGVDSDPGKIRRLLARWPGMHAVVGDATNLPLRDKSVDVAVCVALAHHLGDDALVQLVKELARVTRERVVVFDPVREERSWRGRLLWRIDRGAFPRSESELRSLLNLGLTQQREEHFAIHHHYLLWVGRPTEARKSPIGSTA